VPSNIAGTSSASRNRLFTLYLLGKRCFAEWRVGNASICLGVASALQQF